MSMKFEIGLRGKNYDPGPLFIERIAPKLPQETKVYWIEYSGAFINVMTTNGKYTFSPDGEAWGREEI